MARTFIRQATQIRRSEAYTDSLNHGNTLEQGAVSIEDDLNGLRSQIKRILDGSGAGHWYDALPQYNAAPTGIAQVNQNLTTLNTTVEGIRDRKLLSRVQVLGDIEVPAGQNYLLLTVADSTAPSAPIAYAEGDGAIVGVASAAGHSLDVTAGPNDLSPKNLVLIRDGDTGQPLQSGGRDIFGLLQVGDNDITAGTPFDDADAQGRISFVRPNSGFDGLEAVPVADIEGKNINYSYVIRAKFRDVPEEAFIANSTFTDLTAEVDVTLNRALANHPDVSAEVTKDLDFKFNHGSSAFTLTNVEDDFVFGINLGGAESSPSLDYVGGNFTIDSSNAKFKHALTVDDDGEPIVIGGTAGFIESTGGSLGLRGSTQLLLDDAARVGSTWVGEGLALSASSAEWTSFTTQFGATSLIGAIYKAAVQGSRGVKTYATVTANIPADTDVGGTAGGPNLDAQLPNMSGGSFDQDYDIYVNGELLRAGGNAGADHDYYPGTSLALGQLKMEFALRVGDVICVVPATVAGA